MASQESGPSCKRPQALHDANLLRRVLETSAMPFCAADAQGRVLAYNQAFCLLCGRDAETLEGLDLWEELVAPSWRSRAQQALASLAQGSAHLAMEVELALPDGQALPVEMLVHALPGPGGELAGTWSFLRDLRQHHQVREAVRDRENRYRAVVESLEGLVYVCSPEGRIEFMNPRLMEMLGRDATGEICHQALHGQMEPCPWCLAQEATESGGTRGEVFSPRDGTWWYVVNTPLRRADGRQSQQTMLLDITTQKQAERDLRESEAKFRALTETTASAIFIIQDNALRYTNPAAHTLTGYHPEEISALDIWSLVHPEHRQIVMMRHQQRIQGLETPSRYEFKLVRKDGEVRWVDFTAARVEYQGRPAVLGTAFDISNHKQALEALRESRRRLEQIIAFLPDPAFAVDREGTLIAWNRAAEELTGEPAELMLGKGNHEYTLPFYGLRRPALLDLAMGWNDKVAALYPSIQRDNHTLVAEVKVPALRVGEVVLWAKAAPLYDAQGHIVGAIEAVRDITERKKLEAELRESAEKHQALVRNLPLGVITVDAEMRITELNTQGEEITGVSQADALGKFCWEVLKGENCHGSCPLMGSGAYRHHGGPLETTVLNRLRGPVPVRLSAARLSDSQGKVVGGVEVFQDISQLKSLERERANIVSMFAHDMKSPLVSIQGFALRLLTEPVKNSAERRDKYLDIIRKEAGKLEALINDFLDFSRLESGRLRLNFSATDLDKEFLELFDLFQERFAQAGMKLEMRLAEKLPVIEADAARLRRVFINLLENALKYSGAGTTVTMEASDSGPDILVKISDQGIGIAPEELPYIFDVFYRGSGRGERQGHGLGLAGVEAIIKGHGGRVMVASQEGVGSVFTVALPKNHRLLAQ